MATLKTNSALRCTGIHLTIAVATTMAAILPARPTHAVSQDDLPGVEVPAGWVLNPQGKSPFQVMVPFLLDEFAKPEGNADNNLHSFLGTLPDTKVYSSFYTARKGEAAGADALKDSADLMQQEALRHSLTLYGGSGVAWMALDPDAYQALETCVHGKTNDPNGRKTCLEELKAGSDTFIETWTGAWGKDKWIFEKYFSSAAVTLVRAYAVDWKHKSLGNWQYQAPPELSTRLATLQTGLIEPVIGGSCDKNPVPGAIGWVDPDLASLEFPIEADLYAMTYKDSSHCAGFKEALAALASWQERKLVALLLRAAGTQVGVPERERDVLLREAERMERGMRFNTGRAYYLELLRETLTRDDTEFRQKVLARLASNWTGRR